MLPNIQTSFYVGTFERSSRFEAHLDPTGFALLLEAICHVHTFRVSEEGQRTGGPGRKNFGARV